jgi:long-chain acyl-CoA synthetase
MSPTRRAIVDDKRSYKSIEILIGALHVAAAVGPRCESKTIGLLIPTSGAFPIAALAGWMLGKVVVPLNYLLKPDELQFVIDDCQTDTVVTVQPLLDHLGADPRVKNLMRLEDMSFKGVPAPLWPAHASKDDLAVLLYTSGTSGKPKGVMLTHGNISANIRQCCEWVNIGKKDVMLGILPQFHSFGLTVLTLLPLTVGARAVYTARFVPHKIVGLFREHRPTVFIGIPSMFGALLTAKSAKPDDFSSLRCAVSGGEPLSDDVSERFKERFGVTISEGYGLTETSPATNWCRPWEYRPHSVGMALPGIDTRIVSLESEQDLGANEEGEIRFRGPNIMQGYFNRPDESKAAFDERGYFRTGDIGKLDDDGFLSITGRLKEMLIVGGENVFPREIEEVLNRHPSVHASAVLGLTDPVRGEVPVAFVETEDDAEFDERALKNWCRESLAGYKVPRDIRKVDALPRNPTGKIMRRELKPLLESDAESDAEGVAN